MSLIGLKGNGGIGGPLTLKSGATDQIGLTVQGVQSQSADIFDVTDAGGLVRLGVTGDNRTYLGSGGPPQFAALTVSGVLSNYVSLMVAGKSGQSVDIAQFTNNLFTPYCGVRSDGLFYATAAGTGIATLSKAGAPLDADWAVAPPNGTLVVDSTNNKLWARVAGVWKGVAIA